MVAVVLLCGSNAAMAQVCTFGITDINFGNLSLSGGGFSSATGTFSASCTGLANRTIRICPNLGEGSGGIHSSGNPRYLTQGSARVNYNLYQNTGVGQIWGSHVWPYPPTPPTITLALSAVGAGTASRSINARLGNNQPAVTTGTFQSIYSGGHTLIDYGYAPTYSCGTTISTRAQRVPFTVRLTNNSSCTVNTTALNFGTQFNLSANRDATNTITVNCTAGTAYTVGLSNGTGGGTGPTARRMTNTATPSYVTYGIFRDAARTQPWGDISGTNTAAATGNGTNQAFTGYGRVPVQVEPPTLTYTDTVIATITY